MNELVLSESAAARAREARFSVAVVIHTTRSDWSRLQLAGIGDTLESYGATLLEVVDCGFHAQNQVAALDRLIQQAPDAIISLPLDNLRTADAHRRVTEAGITLVLMDNAPIGMVAGRHYATLVSADNFGNGEIAASLLAPKVRPRGAVGIIGFGVDFFVTNEREIGFRKWMRERRPDVTIHVREFLDVEQAGTAALALLAAHPRINALFVSWDEPAIRVSRAVDTVGRDLPITTIDLGHDTAIEIARGGPICGVGAQMPYDLGVAEATAAIMALVGVEPPPWVALPAFSVSRANVVDAYSTVWHRPAPDELVQALGSPAAGG